MFKILALVAALTQTASAIKFGQPTFFGSGCPQGTVSVVPSTDGNTVSVLFSAFSAETTVGKQRERTSCNVAMNVDVEPGFAVAMQKVDYRGNVYVPYQAGSYADFTAEYFFAGSKGPQTKRRFQAGSNQDIFLSETISEVVWSPCGASLNFRANAALVAYKNAVTNQDVQIAIDSADATRGFRYEFITQKC